MRVAYQISILFLVFTLTSCTKSPYTNRDQFILISPSTEFQMGYQAEQEILKKSKISKNIRYKNLVNKIGRKVARVANQPNFRWNFHVIEGKEINAFCLPGGKVFVYTGLIKLVDNEAQLASVIAHEVAHAIARHGAERVSMMQLGQIGKKLAIQAADPKYKRTIEQVYGISANYGVFLPYSRSFEYEADEIGVILMAKAGYNPKESVKFWQKMMRASRSMRKPPEFASTHPSDIKRIQRLQALMPKALRYYR
jgi:predicted Zn-dependent protease